MQGRHTQLHYMSIHQDTVCTVPFSYRYKLKHYIASFAHSKFHISHLLFRDLSQFFWDKCEKHPHRKISLSSVVFVTTKPTVGLWWAADRRVLHWAVWCSFSPARDELHWKCDTTKTKHESVVQWQEWEDHSRNEPGILLDINLTAPSPVGLLNTLNTFNI